MAWGLVVAVCLGSAWLLRGLLIYEKHVKVGLVDLRGGFADAWLALLVVGLVGSALATRRWWGRLLGIVIISSFVLASFAMYEFISIFDSLHALSHVGYLQDATFLGGSARHLRHPVLLLSMLALAITAVWFARCPPRSWWRRWFVALAASACAQAVIPASGEVDEWRQRHAIQANSSFLPSLPAFRTRTTREEVRAVFRGDLGGTRWIEPLVHRPNVLLILVEAASGAYLPSVAAAEGVTSDVRMPKLDALSQRHLLLSRVVAHQRQTNRGEYAILCGDYPKLLTDQSKMTEQVYGPVRRCLPAVLRDAGYRTVYIQAAPLAFMLKDQFMPKAGFEQLVGEPAFERSYARTDWGVDDRAFFEQALERVSALHEGGDPFFATLLTVGTHHPYTIPEVAAVTEGESRQARAFRYADDALASFIEELEGRGMLQDTVVIITSDESAGLPRADSAVQRLLSQSWSFVVVMFPEPRAERIDTGYAHVDTALSVTDLLGIDAPGARFAGRSWFRRYDIPRRLFAANTYARRVIEWRRPGDALLCDELFRACTQWSLADATMFGAAVRAGRVRPAERQLAAEVARLSRSGRADMSRSRAIALLTADEIVLRAKEGKKLLAGGQYLRVPGRTDLQVSFDLEVEGGEGSVLFHQDVFLNGHERFVRKEVRLAAGERWRLRYTIGVPDESSHLVVQLYATAESESSVTIRVHDALLSMTPGDSSDVVVIEDQRTPTALP